MPEAPTPSPAPAEAAPPAPLPKLGAPPPWDRVEVQDRMHEQFAFATDAVFGVILGDLDAVHQRSQRLAALPPPPDLPPAWHSYLDAMKVAADRGATTPDLEAAASDVITIGRTCANCHSQSHAGPTPTTDDVLGPGWPSEIAMHRHSYGTYLMWLGVVLPSDAVFRSGVEQLSHADAIPDVAPELVPLEAQVHALAAKAASATDPQVRVDAFADLLRSCAACHAAAGARIPR
ncbi:MAG: hypothetical protein ABMB14_22460, partial [Myxococcota bacterium]